MFFLRIPKISRDWCLRSSRAGCPKIVSAADAAVAFALKYRESFKIWHVLVFESLAKLVSLNQAVGVRANPFQITDETGVCKVNLNYTAFAQKACNPDRF
jgi:hypothetical protein